MKNGCVICKTMDEEQDCFLNREKIYKKYRCHEFWLCYKHSVEFFKMGQENFILKYPQVAKEHDWTSEGGGKKIGYFF